MRGPISQRTEPAKPQLTLDVAWTTFLTLVIAGPWLINGYLFGTDWPGPRRIDFPSVLSSSAPFEVILAAVSRVLSSEVTGKLVVFGLLFAASMTAYRALVIGSFVPRATASLVYVVNPFVYGRLHYGQLFLLAGYAALPWAALSYRRLLQEPGMVTGLFAGLSLALVGILSLHIFLIAAVLGSTLVIAHIVAVENRLTYLMSLAPGLLLAVAVTVGASAYWIGPLLNGTGPTATVIAGVGSGDLAASGAVPDQRLGLLPNLLGLYGFWAEDAGRFTSMKAFVPLWPVILALLLLTAAVGAVDAFRHRRDQFAPWVAGLLAAAAIALILEAGVSSPVTSGLVTWLDAHLPFYRGMRDAGKWAALLALVYSQLIGLGAARILDWIRERKVGGASWQWVNSTAIGLLLAFPLYFGNGLLYGMHGEIRPSQYPQGWYAADRVLIADRHPGRTLFLPWHEYMSLSFVRNQNSVVASPAPSFFTAPVLVSADPEVPGVPPPADPDQVAIARLVAAGSHSNWAEVLAARNVKYVLLAREADWNFYNYLNSQSGLLRIGDYGSIVVYRNSLVS